MLVLLQEYFLSVESRNVFRKKRMNFRDLAADLESLKEKLIESHKSDVMKHLK